MLLNKTLNGAVHCNTVANLRGIFAGLICSRCENKYLWMTIMVCGLNYIEVDL